MGYAILSLVQWFIVKIKKFIFSKTQELDFLGFNIENIFKLLRIN